MIDSIPGVRGVRRWPPSRKKAAVRAVLAVLVGLVVARLVTAGTLYDPLMLFMLIAAVSALSFLMIPEYAGLLIVMAYLSAEGMLKLYSNYHPIVHLSVDILVMLLLFRWLGRKISLGETFEQPPYFWLLATFAGWVMVQVANPYALGLVPSIGTFKIYLTMIPIYFLAYDAVRSEEDLRRFLWVHMSASVVCFVAAIVQYIVGPSSVDWLPGAAGKLWQFEGYFFRPFGTTANPGGAAVYSHLALPFAIIGLWIFRGWLARTTILLVCLLATVTLFVSQVRSLLVWSVLVVVLVVLLAPETTLGRVFSLFSVGALGLLGYLMAEFLGGMVVLARFATLLEAKTYTESRAGGLDAILWNVANLPFGAGLGRTGAAAAKFAAAVQANPVHYAWADNFWAKTLVDVGILGSVLLTIILLVMTWQGVRLLWRLRTRTCRLMAVAIAVLFVSLFPQSWGGEPLLGNPYTAYFWFLTGVIMRLPEIDRRTLESQAASARGFPAP